MMQRPTLTSLQVSQRPTRRQMAKIISKEMFKDRKEMLMWNILPLIYIFPDYSRHLFILGLRVFESDDIRLPYYFRTQYILRALNLTHNALQYRKHTLQFVTICTWLQRRPTIVMVPLLSFRNSLSLTWFPFIAVSKVVEKQTVPGCIDVFTEPTAKQTHWAHDGKRNTVAVWFHHADENRETSFFFLFLQRRFLLFFSRLSIF